MEGLQPGSGIFSGREHHLAVRVYYEDTDFTGVVYHGNYLRFLERGRSDFLRLAGVSHSALLQIEQPSAFVVTRMEIDFKRPAKIDDALIVVTTYNAVRGPRLFISQTIRRQDTVIVRAEVEAACITLDGRPRKPPPGMVENLKPWFDPVGHPSP